jgi:YfiR/HmsC-like
MAARAPRLRDRRTLRTLAAALALALIAWPSAAAADSLETAVKATYLYKFAPFVTWPGGGQSFTICVVGPDPFGPVLDRAVAGQQANGRAIVVRRLAQADRAQACDIVYLGGTEDGVREALRRLHGAPVLTVTDSGAAPGVIDFVIDQGRVRFRIDDEAAAENGLVISSKLLGLAVSVNPRRGARP